MSKDISTFAGTDGVRTLYKFMNYPPSDPENAEQIRRVEALLQKGELYFPKASELNDPFEASPHFYVPGETQDEIISRVKHEIRNSFGPKNGLTEAQIVEREQDIEKQIISGEFQQNIDFKQKVWIDDLRGIPMCCFTATRESILLWSYYANGHSGICVHFDATTKPFQAAQRVIYKENYPTIHFPIGNLDPKELLTIAVLTKSDVWRHEKEYRLVNVPMSGSTSSPSPGIYDDFINWGSPQLAVLASSSICGVTVGASMQHTQIENILRICHNRPVKIPVFLAKCKTQQFGLDFESIS